MIQAALALRDPSPVTQRVFDGAGDGVPGLSIERFGDDVAPPVFRLRGPPGLADLGQAAVAQLPGLAFGRFGHEHTFAPHDDDGERVVVEGGLRFAVRLHGQRNTGLFLDARPARRWVRANADGRRVLNLFAYTCGFGVAAAAGGAQSTVNVDVARPVLDRGRANYRLNDLATDTRTFWKADAREALRKLAKDGVQFDAIILDPPPQAQGKGRKRFDPSAAWPGLLRRCEAILAPEGWLLTLSSPSSTGALAPPDWAQPVWCGGSGPDFRPGPEGGLSVVAFAR